MRVRPIHKNGQLVSFEAFAGKLGGRKMRKRFRVSAFKDTEKARRAAEKWAKDKKDQLNSQRAFGAVLDERTLLQVTQAIELLGPHDVSLIDCVREWVSDREKRNQQDPAPSASGWTYEEAYNRLLENRKRRGVSGDYLKHLQTQLEVFAAYFGEQQLDSVTVHHIEAWLDERKVSPVTRGNWRRDLSMVWRFAMLRGFATQNPATLLSIPDRRADSEISVLKVQDAEKLFEALKRKQDPESQQVALFASMACFAGLRTIELTRLEWSMVDLSSGYIDVPAKVSKTRARRIVSLPENLFCWLRKFNVAEGPLLTLKPRRVRSVLSMCNVVLPRNVMRHSWFSYHLAKHQNQNLTQLEGGHASADVLYRHYRALVTKDQATRYFEIVP